MRPDFWVIWKGKVYDAFSDHELVVLRSTDGEVLCALWDGARLVLDPMSIPEHRLDDLGSVEARIIAPRRWLTTDAPPPQTVTVTSSRADRSLVPWVGAGSL